MFEIWLLDTGVWLPYRHIFIDMLLWHQKPIRNGEEKWKLVLNIFWILSTWKLINGNLVEQKSL